jgi:ferric-dicitrate binding protein FerR (iron transport regulator)
MDRDLLYRFFEGKTSFMEEESIRMWLNLSGENRDILFAERKQYDAILLLAKQDDLSGFVKRKTDFKLILFELLKVAAVVLVTLVGGYTYWYNQSSAEKLAMQEIHVSEGRCIDITLQDGTRVWLNAQTTLRYPIQFGGDNRSVTLDGEAYFEVSEDKDRPFIVKTERGKVQVFGTKFNIEDYAGSQTFETTLMEGSVEVMSAVDPSKKVRLTPDKKALLVDGQFVIEQVDDYNPYRWREGLICFRNESFKEIMNEFKKYYGVDIIVRNKEVQEFFYTGKFRQTDGINYSLRVLQQDIQFKYNRDDEKQIIYID